MPPSPGSSYVPPPRGVADAERPNIVFLLTDDQTLSEMRAMPKTRSLVGERGVTFQQALSQYPLCCPARGSLLSGQLPHNHGAMGNVPPWGSWSELRDRDNLLPTWLQAAGYRTGYIGKYLNGYPEADDPTYVPPGWDDWVVPISDEYSYVSRALNVNGELVTNHQYQSKFVSSQVSRLIREYSKEEAPFYIWSGFLAPHDGYPADPIEPNRPTPPMRSPYVEAKYRNTESGKLADNPSVFEENTSDKVRRLRRDRDFTRRDVEIQAEQRLESLRSVDDAVAKIVRTLRQTGELKNTMLVFTSDNGFLLGEHGLDQKVYGYEPSIRVPLMIAGPGVPTGVTRTQQVGLVDLASTMLEWAGATPGRTQDGTSLVPVMNDPKVLADRYMLLEAGGDPFPKVKHMYTGVRTSDGHVLLRYWNGWIETYDLTTDPYQLDGRTSKAERAWRPDLLAELDRLQKCAGTSCVVS